MGSDIANELRAAEPVSMAARLEVVPEVEDVSVVRTRDLERWVSAKDLRGSRGASRRAIKPYALATAALVRTLALNGHLRPALRVYGVVSFCTHCSEMQYVTVPASF